MMLASNVASSTLAQFPAQVNEQAAAKVETISNLIREYAEKNGADVDLALNVACAESCTRNDDGEVVFNPEAKNPKSTASGVYQFIDGTWKSVCDGEDVFDIEQNIDCGTRLLAEKNGIKHWEDSKNKGFGGGWSKKPYEVFAVVN